MKGTDYSFLEPELSCPYSLLSIHSRVCSSPDAHEAWILSVHLADVHLNHPACTEAVALTEL